MPGYKEVSPGTRSTLFRDVGLILSGIDNIRTEVDRLEREVKDIERYVDRLDDSEDEREDDLAAEWNAGQQYAKDTVDEWYCPPGG